jgi:hypothetical protein
MIRCVMFNLIENGKSPNCSSTDSSCIFEDTKSGQKFNVFVEIGKDANGEPAWVGTFSACLEVIRVVSFPVKERFNPHVVKSARSLASLRQAFDSVRATCWSTY